MNKKVKRLLWQNIVTPEVQEIIKDLARERDMAM